MAVRLISYREATKPRHFVDFGRVIDLGVHMDAVLWVEETMECTFMAKRAAFRAMRRATVFWFSDAESALLFKLRWFPVY